MRIIEKGQRRVNLTRKGYAMILTPIILLSSYLGVGMFIFLDLSSYSQDLGRYYWYDSDDCVYTGDRKFDGFYDDAANWTFLELRANQFEDWTDMYNIGNESWGCVSTIADTHMEYGMTSPFDNFTQYEIEVNDFLTNSSSKFREIDDKVPYAGYGDSPIWTANYMSSLAYHYAVACEEEDIEEANEVLAKLKRPVDGIHVLTHVTGLDGNLARYAVKDTKTARKRFPSYFYDLDADGDYTIEKEFGSVNNKWPGQGDYEDWIYDDKTSRDQHLGVFLGWSTVHKLLTKFNPDGVNESLRDDILDTVEEDGEDTLDCLIGGNWHIIAGEDEIGYGRGIDGGSFYPRLPWTSGGDIIFGLLAFGKRINSEKYTPYYNQIINRFLSAAWHYSSDQSGSYYGNNLAFEAMFIGYLNVRDPDVKEVIRHHYNDDFYEHVQYHRNSLFNLGYLIVNEIDLEDILDDDDLSYRLDDITDNLDRVATWRFPSRDWHIPEVEDYEDLVHPTAKRYSKIFAEDSTHVLNYLYGWLFNEFASTEAKSKFALGADELGSTDFIWQRSPFSPHGTHADDDDYKGTKQNPGIDYTFPYWMLRYYGYIPGGD